MGGPGSGRRWRYGTRSTVEDSLPLDAGTMRQKGALIPGSRTSGVWSWLVNDRVCASLSYLADLREGEGAPLVQLRYTAGRGEGVREMSYWVELETTRLPSGGLRYWFRCPLWQGERACGRRVARLYLPPGGTLYGCRHCHDLTYESCNDSHRFDAMYAMLAADLGWSAEDVRETLRGVKERWRKPERGTAGRGRRSRRRA